MTDEEQQQWDDAVADALDLWEDQREPEPYDDEVVYAVEG